MQEIIHTIKKLLLPYKDSCLGRLLYEVCRRLFLITRNCIGNLSVLHKAYRIKKQILKLKAENKKIIFLFGAPNHSNLGDNAQTVCIHDWIKKNYPDHELFIFSFAIETIYLHILKPVIHKNDMLFLHSGYHFTGRHALYLYVYMPIFKLFPSNPIFFFPQTVSAPKNQLESLKIIAENHKNFIFAARDAVSYDSLAPYFKNFSHRLLLLPDIVTTLIGNHTPSSSHIHNEILLCLRNDEEKKWSTEKVVDSLSNVSMPIKLTDTTISSKFYEDIEMKRSCVYQLIDYFSQFKIVITDRYHGTIFSLIANVPVIVLDSTDHKLSSGVNWFMGPEFSGRIYYAKTLNEVEGYIQHIVKSPPLSSPLPILYKKYYKNLKVILSTIYECD